MKTYTAVLVVGFMLGCGVEKGKSPKVKLKMTKVNSAALAEVETYSAPTSFKITPLAVELSTGESGQASHMVVWANSGCSPEKSKFEKNDKEYEYFDAFVCDLSAGNKEIELMDQDAVNAEFNSQSWSVVPQTYSYATIVMTTSTSKSNATVRDNMSFIHAEMTSALSYQTSDNYRTAQNAGGIVINEGDTIDVTVEYDVSKFVLKTVAEAELSASKECQLSEDKKTSYCARIGADALSVKVN